MDTERSARPDKVVCLICDRRFDLLHGSHLRVHDLPSQAEYREDYEIDSRVPLNSQRYADAIRVSHDTPGNRQRSADIGRKWQLRRRLVFAVLERDNFYTPGRTAAITGIPVQTLYSAIRRGDLPSARACVLINIGGRFVPESRNAVWGITLEDMSMFVKEHKPKKPTKVKT